MSLTDKNFHLQKWIWNVCMKISSRKSFLFGQLFENLGKVIIFLNFLLFQRIFKKSRKLFLRSYQRKFQIIIELIDEILKIWKFFRLVLLNFLLDIEILQKTFIFNMKIFKQHLSWNFILKKIVIQIICLAKIILNPICLKNCLKKFGLKVFWVKFNSLKKLCLRLVCL